MRDDAALGDKLERFEAPLQHALRWQLPPVFQYRCVNPAEVGRMSKVAIAIQLAQPVRGAQLPDVVVAGRDAVLPQAGCRLQDAADPDSVGVAPVTCLDRVADQVRATTRNLRTDFGIALKILVPLIVVIFCRDRRSRMRNLHLAALSVMVMGAYALLFSEARLIGFWLALLVVSVLTGITLHTEESRGRTGRAFVHVISVISVISFVTYILDQSLDSRPDRGFGARHLQLDVASKLRELGIQPGSRVAVVGDESDIYWARLARVQAAIQIPLPEAPKYWSMPESARGELNRRMALTGSRAIIASWTDPPAADRSWIRVPGTRYSILPIR